jgi:hypothetical protein
VKNDTTNYKRNITKQAWVNFNNTDYQGRITKKPLKIEGLMISKKDVKYNDGMLLVMIKKYLLMENISLLKIKIVII